MDARSVLRAHVAEARNDVRAVEGMVVSPAAGRLAGSAALERVCAALGRQLAGLESVERALTPESSTATAWAHLHSIRTDIDETLRDALDLLGGLFVEQSGLDQGFLAVADALLSEIAEAMPRGIDWPTVMMSTGDAFSPLTGTLWTRFPDFSVWALPMIAHEAGHVATQEVKVLQPDASGYDFPITALATEHGEWNERYARELIADFFGTWSLGPAYACSAVLLRFSPQCADEPEDLHPPEQQRVRLILETLTRVDENYGDVRQYLEQVWQDMVQPFGPSPISDGDAALLTSLAERLTAAAAEHFPHACYAGRTQMRDMSDLLERNALSAATLDPQAGIRDVVNAAWIARLRNPTGTPGIGPMEQSALAACRTIAMRARPNGGNP